MAEISCIYFLSFSLYAVPKFVSKGTVISTILQSFFSVFQITKSGLFFSAIGWVRIFSSHQISIFPAFVIGGGLYSSLSFSKDLLIDHLSYLVVSALQV